MELRRPPSNVVVLRPPIPDSSVDQVIVRDLKPWDSFFLVTVGLALMVVIPFFVLFAFFGAARLGIWVGIGSLLALTGLLGLSTWLTARPVLALSRAAEGIQSGDSGARAVPGGGLQTRRLAAFFNSMVDRALNELPRLRGDARDFAKRLSTSADMLANAAAGQSEAAARTSPQLEELAVSSGVIATLVGGVVSQAEELRANIQRAHTDLQASSDRTQANARRVDEIRTVLELLNDIADQTALLALNAAIEAARAGESGRGFAVVADEVRRLAERSKAAAAQIATLTEGAQATSGEAVAAIERRGQQLTRWMDMTEAMAEVSARVQPAVQQQNSATNTVKLAIQLIADRSHAVEAAAHEVVSAAAAHAALVPELGPRLRNEEETGS